METFAEPEQAASFLNYVGVRPEQLVSVQFQAVTATAQRILVTCRLSTAQWEARFRWQEVERMLHGPTPG